MSKARRTAIYDIRYLSSSVRLRGILWDVGWGCATGTLKPSLSAAHAHTAYTTGVRPRALKSFAINRNYLMLLRMRCSCFVYFRSGRILFSMLSCVYLVVVQIFTAANTSEIIHKTNSSIWDLLKRVNSHICCLFLFSFINFQAELLVFVKEHFDFRPAWRRQLFFAF